MYFAIKWRSWGSAQKKLGVTASQLGLPSLTPLSVASRARLQLGVANWATSVVLLQDLIIDPTNSGSRFSYAGLLAIEDCSIFLFIFLYIFLYSCSIFFCIYIMNAMPT